MKNKKILSFTTAILILSLTTTLKINAMEKNQKNVIENTKTTEENFNFSEDKYFNDVLEDHLKYVFSTILVEDLKKYLLNSVKYIKNMPLKEDYTYILTNPNQQDLFNNLREKFKDENKIYIEKNIKLNKNIKINFYYYKYLIYRLYDCAFWCIKDYATFKFYEYIKKNKDYSKIIDAITKYGERLFDGVSDFVKREINLPIKNNEKYFKIPKEYDSFENYLKKNPNISFEDEKDDMHKAIKDSLCFHGIDKLISKNLKKIYEIAGI